MAGAGDRGGRDGGRALSPRLRLRAQGAQHAEVALPAAGLMGQGLKYFQILPGGICFYGLRLDQPG